MQLDLTLHNKRNQKKKAEKVDNNILYIDRKIETGPIFCKKLVMFSST